MYLKTHDLSCNDDRVRVSTDILALLFYPTDKLKQKYLSCSLFCAYTSLKTKNQNQIFSTMGGIDALVRADSLYHLADMYDDLFSQWQVASECVQHLAVMKAFHNKELNDGASISKAIDLLIKESKSKHSELPSNAKYIRDAWSKFKPVSFYCAAFQILQITFAMEQIESNPIDRTVTNKLREKTESDLILLTVVLPLIVKKLNIFLCIASAYQEFLLNFKSNRSRETIISQETSILLPRCYDIPDLSKGESLDPIEPDRLHFLKNRRAPKKI